MFTETWSNALDKILPRVRANHPCTERQDGLSVLALEIHVKSSVSDSAVSRITTCRIRQRSDAVEAWRFTEMQCPFITCASTVTARPQHARSVLLFVFANDTSVPNPCHPTLPHATPPHPAPRHPTLPHTTPPTPPHPALRHPTTPTTPQPAPLAPTLPHPPSPHPHPVFPMLPHTTRTLTHPTP